MAETVRRSAPVNPSTAIDRLTWLVLAGVTTLVLVARFTIPAAGWGPGLVTAVSVFAALCWVGWVVVDTVADFRNWRRARQLRAPGRAHLLDTSGYAGRPFDQHSPLWAALELYHGAPASEQTLIGPSMKAIALEVDPILGWRQVGILDRSLELWQTEPDPPSRQSLTALWASAPTTREGIEAAELVLLDLELRQAQVEFELEAMAPLPSNQPVELTDWAAQRERSLVIDLFAPARLDAEAAAAEQRD